MNPSPLYPPPRHLTVGSAEPARVSGWTLEGDDPPGLATIGHEPLGRATFSHVDLPHQAYRLRVERDRAVIEASSPEGFRYGWVTLGQWTVAHPQGVPPVVIDDAPDFPVRGFMLDISRDKVPTLDALKAMIDQLAAWKINHLQLYTEHTFAYQRHETVWREASPITAAEARELSAYCRERGIDLAPNQNSFGHFTRWLNHPAYRHLAECPDGFTTPWGETRTRPFSLNPLHPGSFELIRELFDELLPNFTSPLVNIGCDETFDLGQGASAEACAQRGKGRVYLDFLLRIHDLIAGHGRRTLFWGDIILHHPELIPELPSDITALAWGYEADHPFERELPQFATSGTPFWVCPGTSMWNSITGRHANAMANLAAAARHGLAHGAQGYLITEWGDNGHWQPWTFSQIPILIGAGHGWNTRAVADLDPADLLPRHLPGIQTREQAEALIDLASASTWVDHRMANASPLFYLLLRKDPTSLLEKISREELHVVRERLAAHRTPRNVTDQAVGQDVDLAVSLLDAAALRGLAVLGDAPSQRALPPALQTLLPKFEETWLRRNRPGGLQDSRRPLVEVGGDR